MGTPVILKRLVPSSLLGRSLLIIVMPLLILSGMSSFIFYERHWTTVARKLTQGMAGDIMTVLELRRSTADPADVARLFDLARVEMQLIFAWDPGAILPNQPSLRDGGLDDGPVGNTLRDRLPMPFRIDAETHERDVLVSLQLAEGVMHVQAPMKRLSSATTHVFILWMVGASMILVSLATVFMRNQVRPIRRLGAATDMFGKGRDVPNFKPEGAAEVRQAGQAFNLMRERIRRQIEQRTEMLAGVSHDLRTPLTRMKLQLAMLGDVAGVEELKEDVDEMDRMIEGYLAFARGEAEESIRPASITRLLAVIASRFRRNGATVDLHIERNIAIPMRSNAMERCITNLIGNAARYAGHVAVRIGQRGDAIDIIIDDDGPGIPPDKREEVFKAFYRVEGSRNQATGGVGLGLTIARDVARGHGGDVVLEESPLGGLRARVRLPL